ncbi:uncharacterized protein E6C27_scaffold465G00360 [Cucumis melo var. makuwa]|uniref:Uncharacterized protein n=1 Tax=Cucumis melo var. makuwa TaxID=1194695 RepID=A0A5A7STI3_CUCMM|nr:uncharacterized protein E6C27_scaffold465G00360 [Cucumis melo var. makuwa]
MASETRSTTLSVNSKMETCKGCGYYMQKYIHEIVHNSSTSITSLLNTKSAYRQEEIDEIRTKWAGTGSPIVFGEDLWPKEVKLDKIKSTREDEFNQREKEEAC